MKSTKLLSSLGFTIIELLIVIAIIFIFAGTGIAYYNQYNATKLPEKEARRLVDTLELAKKKSSAADIPFSCSGIFQGYRVTITATGYTLEVRCTSSNYTTLQSYVFDSGVSAAVTGSITVYFPALNGPVGQAPPNTSIKIQNTDRSTCFYITVNEVGTISDVKDSCISPT